MPTLEKPAVDQEVDIAQEFDVMPRCEFTTHPSGLWGHEPDAGAEWLAGLPCGRTVMVCDAWVKTLGTDAAPITVTDNGHKHFISEITLTQLPKGLG
jgi:hypothetical protein